MASSSKKPRVDQARNLINVDLKDFKKIAINFQNMLVDKTELIYIFRTVGRKHELITAPPGFGKSVNLTMFKYFFEIEVDPKTGRLETQFDPKAEAVTDTENYRMFADLKLDIMKHPELVKEHLGRHPVLYVSFKCNRSIIFDADFDFDYAIKFCRTVVRCSFQQHEYLCVSEKLTDEDKEFCNNWCSYDTYKKMDLSHALERLAELLYEHFERDVVLLVDEYDSFVAKALDEANKSNVEDVCEVFGVDRRVARELLSRYDRWMEQINQKHDITPILVRALINARQQTREEICKVNGVDVNVAQQLVDEYKQQMTDCWSISNLSSKSIASYFIYLHENNIEQICKKPVDMIASLLKTDNKNIHLLGSLVTGVSYIAGIGWSGIVNNINPCRFTQHHPYNQFYGFQLKEIEVLLEKLDNSSVLNVGKKKAVDIIKAQYNGYEYPGSAGNPSEQMYCPWSVLKCLETGLPWSFWVDSAYTAPLKHMFHNFDVNMFLLEVLEENGTQILPTVGKLTADDLVELKKYMKGIVTKGSHHLFLNFILELGYLTVESTQPQTENGRFIKIPNQVVKKMILGGLREYYRGKCSEDFKINAIRKSGPILVDIDSTANPDVSDKEFEESLRVFREKLQILFQQYSGYLPYVNESGLHCFMNEIITAGSFSYFTGHYVLGTDINKGRLDVLGFRDQFAFLVKLSYLPTSKKSADDDLDYILDKEYFNAFEHPALLASNLKRHILMGISVKEDNKIAISAIRNYDKRTVSHRINIPFEE